MSKRLTLILGGARSGKSAYAEKLAADRGRSILYVATAEARDDEMKARIERHRAGRPSYWKTLEAPSVVGSLLRDHAHDADVVLVDCLTLLASNVLLKLPGETPEESVDAALASEIDALLAVCNDSAAEWIVVSNEVGMGLVPPYRLGRVYRDALGKVNQRLAAAADVVRLMVSGLPIAVKG